MTEIGAATVALEEADHTRLPAWMVAGIAVESATSIWNERIARPLQDEIERLQAEVSRLQV